MTAAPALTSTPSLAAAPSLLVLLVNAMGDAALAVTEQRFQRFLQAVFPGRAISLRCTTPAAIARGEMAAARIARYYAAPGLPAERPDLVVFSGAEPRAAALQEEAFWPELAALFGWVAEARVPALFSCLAAHAAALHFGGVPRERAARKISGVFRQRLAAPHPLTVDAPRSYACAHSRWNGLDAAALRRAGYAVLSAAEKPGGAGADRVEVDAFVPLDGTPHLYLQGHPEYEAVALDGEYRRDLRRHEAGLLPTPPAPPDYAGAAPDEVAACLGFCRTVLGRLVPSAAPGAALGAAGGAAGSAGGAAVSGGVVSGGAVSGGAGPVWSKAAAGEAS